MESTEKIVKGMLTFFEKVDGINLKNRETLFLMLSIPPICNYRCKKCFNSIGSKKAKDLLTLNEIFKVLKEAKEIGVRNINILGEGEPLVYKNIKRVVEYIDKLGMMVTIATNGMMLTRDMAEFLYKHNVIIGVALDTLDEKEYISYCGGNASLKKVLENIDYARKLYSKKIYKKKGYKIYQLVVHTTVTPKNFKKLKEIEDFCAEDIFFDCQSLSWVGDAEKNASFFKDGKNEYKTFQKFGHLIRPPMVLSKIKNGKSLCCLFYYGIFVGSNGNVVLDASIDESFKFIGNVRNYPLKVLDERRKKLRDYFLKKYNLVGYCPIREKSILYRFIKDLKRRGKKIKELMPNFIELETSTFCNRRCSWCPNSKYERGRLKKFISPSLFIKIIDDLKNTNYDGQLALHNYNEPLLDPNLYKYLGIIKTELPAVKIIIFTNGDYLGTEELNNLKRGGVSTIYVSLHDAIGKDNYKEIMLNHLKKIGKENCRPKDVSDVFGKKYKIDWSGMDVVFYIPSPKMMTTRGGIVKMPKYEHKNSFCFLPFSSGAIDYRGNMKICCEIYPQNYLHKKIGLIGNLRNSSFYDLWFSEKYNHLRKSFLANNLKNHICLNCLKNNVNIDKKRILGWKEFLMNKENTLWKYAN